MKQSPLFLLFFLLVEVVLHAQTYCPISFEGENGPTQRIWIHSIKTQPNQAHLGFSHGNGSAYPKNYIDHTENLAFQTMVHQGDSALISLIVRHDTLVDTEVQLHFDWDGNGSFETTQVLGTLEGTEQSISGYIKPTPQALLGKTRMRVIAKIKKPLFLHNTDPCGEHDLGAAEDYGITVIPNTPTQVDTIIVIKNQNPIYKYNHEVRNAGRTKRMVLGFNVKTTGGADNVKMEFIRASPAGSTNIIDDCFVTNAAYSGPDPSAYSTLNSLSRVWSFGGVSYGFDNKMDFITLAPGDNWFWLFVDIKDQANPGNIINLDLELVTLNINGVSQTFTSFVNPPPTQLIVNHSHDSVPINVPSTGSFLIDSVAIGNFKFHRFRQTFLKTTKAFNNYQTHIQPFDLCSGAATPLNVVCNTSYLDPLNESSPNRIYVHAYFDWNQDGYFTPDEHYLLDTKEALYLNERKSFSANITPPKSAKAGYSKMRIISSKYANVNALSYKSNTDDRGEIQEYGYLLHKPGDIEVNYAQPWLGQKDSILLKTTNTSSDFSLQSSQNFTDWLDLPNSDNKEEYYSSILDTTTVFRLKSSNAICPDGYMYSSPETVAFVGVSKITPSPLKKCKDDTVTISAQFESPLAYFPIIPTGSTTGNYTAPALATFAVENYPNTFLHTNLIDSVCTTLKHADSTALYLISPNQEVKILLDNQINNRLPATQTPSLGRYCYTPNRSADLGNHGPGTYASKEPLSRLEGINPNGTWTIMAVAHASAETMELVDCKMYLGINSGIAWGPAVAIEDSSEATTQVAPSASQTYIANISNSLGQFKDSVRVEVLETTPISVEILEDANNSLCHGDERMFTAQLSSPFESNGFEWFINQQWMVGNDSNSIKTSNLENGDSLMVKFDDQHICASFFDADTFIVQVIPKLTPQMELRTSNPLPGCSEKSLTVEIDTAQFGGNIQTQWKLNGIPVNGTTLSFTASNFQNNDVITARVDGSYPCLTTTSLSENLALEILPSKTPQIALRALNPFPICEQNPVSLQLDTAELVAPVSITWLVDEQTVQNGGVTFHSNQLENQSIITAEVNSDYPCYTHQDLSKNLKAEILPWFNPQLELKSLTQLPACEGSEIILQADTFDFGQPSMLTWLVNGNEINHLTNTYESNGLNHLDEVEIRVSSEYPCLSVKTRTDRLTITTEKAQAPSIAIADKTNDKCAGNTFYFEVTEIQRGGVTPKIQWQINHEVVPNAKGEQFSSDGIKLGDVITAAITSSAQCITQAGATSAAIEAEVWDLPDAQFTLNYLENDSVELIPSNGDLLVYEWNLANGEILTDVQPMVHKSSVEGAQICLTTTNEKLCSNSYCHQVITSIHEEEVYFTVAPNPSSGLVTISSNQNLNGLSLQIIGNDGKQVDWKPEINHNGSNQVTVDLTKLAKGIYMVVLKTETSLQSHRVVKN